MKFFAGFGEVLWDLLPNGAKLGGAVLNFSCRLAGLGENSALISRLGEDERGKKAREEMIALGLNCDLIQTDATKPTGTVEVNFSETGEPDYFIVPDVAYDSISPDKKMLELAVEADFLCYGTLIQRSEISRRTLAQILERRQGKMNLLDLNLRKNCYTEETILSSLKYASLLKLNENEAAYLTRSLGLKATNFDEFTDEMLLRFGLSHCLLTLGENGVFAKSDKNETIYIPGYRVKIGDLIGAGDSFAAGFALQHIHGKGLEESCDFGNRLGAIVATHSGGTTPLTSEEVANYPFELCERSYVEDNSLKLD